MGLPLSSFERWWLNAWPHRLHVHWYVPRFLRDCPLPFRGEVLEVGAGSGWTSRAILESFPQVELTATDIDFVATRRFRRLQSRYGRRLRVLEADILNLPFDRAAFDMVVAFHVMRHVEDIGLALTQLIRVLRPGGLLGIADRRQRFTWDSAEALSRVRLEGLVAPEATIRVSRGETYFYLWAQKAHPF